MIATIGLLAILLAAAASVVLVFRAWSEAARPEPKADAVRLPVMMLLVGSILAFVALELGILSDDFTLSYVAGNSSTTTPLIFKLAGAWAALEGSIVLWGLVLAVVVYFVARSVQDGDRLGLTALSITGVVSLFWFGLMATVANPFEVCTEVVGRSCAETSWLPFVNSVAPGDGSGANPLLQNHILMAVHPPMLYVGYVGFTAPFAFAIAAMIRGDQGSVWLERTRRWSVIAWAFLGFGMLLGAWWSYEVLGWGGYWAWDPVENAALLPWLAATAFIHSAVVQRRRGMLQAWNLILVIATFSLTIFGTFLTRSGTIISVHSFTQSEVGPVLLGFLMVVVIGSLALFAARSHLLGSAPRLDSVASREGMFLLNNLILTVLALAVLLGTVYPIVLEAMGRARVSVGTPYYNRVSLPIAFLLLLAMGVGSVTPYRHARRDIVWSRIAGPLLAGLVVGAISVVAGVGSVPVVILLILGSFVIATILKEFLRQVRKLEGARRAAVARVLTRDPGYWGGQIAHIGVALLVIGIAASSGLASRDQVRVAVGDAVVVADYCIIYEMATSRSEPNRQVTGAQLSLRDADCSRELATLEPVFNRYARPPAVATPAVRTGIGEDVFVALATVPGDDVVLDVMVFPLMWVLWTGGLIMVGGGVWAVAARKRKAAEPKAAARV
ncbi:MAG: cytochrome c-type biogenesis CcmF C-terminal domain-containing protein [Acidimicrobiia bacterium]|nr:cytochrome c-type biogenesis CcmF C-terminal domain-containing protein [Acidimicrobiia bacterium]